MNPVLTFGTYLQTELVISALERRCAELRSNPPEHLVLLDLPAVLRPYIADVRALWLPPEQRNERHSAAAVLVLARRLLADWRSLRQGKQPVAAVVAPTSATAAAWPQEPRAFELAPEGWHRCVERVARGIAYLDGDAAYCGECGAELKKGIGHDLDCLVLHARRVLEWNNMRTDFYAKVRGPLEGVDIDAIHHKNRQIEPGRDDGVRF